MTFLQRIMILQELDCKKLYDKCTKFRERFISYNLLCKLCSDNPPPVQLKKIKYLALVLGCVYTDLIYGAGNYKGLQIKL